MLRFDSRFHGLSGFLTVGGQSLAHASPRAGINGSYDPKRPRSKCTTEVVPELRVVLGKYFSRFGRVSQGSDEFLYLAIQEPGLPNDHYLYKLDPDTGDNAFGITPQNLGHFTGDDAIFASCTPMVVKIGTMEWIYTSQRGKLRKWSTSLLEETGPTSNWPVLLQQSGTDLLPICFNLSRNDQTLIGAGTENLSNSTKTLIFAVDKQNGTKTTFNLYQWVMDRRCLTQTCVDRNQCSHGSECFIYPDTTVSVNNTVGIGPDPTDSSYDLVYTLIKEKFLFAIRFHLNNKTWGSMKWKFPYSPQQSDTSPTVSADGNRVYIASGSVPGSTSTLDSIRTSDGVSVAESNFDVKKVTGTPVVETVNGKNRIYIQSDGSLMGFEDDLQSSTLSCSWMNVDTITIMKGSAGKSVGTGQSGTGLLYVGYKVSSTRYAAGFDPDAQWARGSCPVTRGGTAVWSIQMGTSIDEEDNCTRAIGVYQGKGQVYFGTNRKFFAYEEATP